MKPLCVTAQCVSLVDASHSAVVQTHTMCTTTSEAQCKLSLRGDVHHQCRFMSCYKCVPLGGAGHAGTLPLPLDFAINLKLL